MLKKFKKETYKKFKEKKKHLLEDLSFPLNKQIYLKSPYFRSVDNELLISKHIRFFIFLLQHRNFAKKVLNH